jgi:hypothetical protein
MNLFGTAANYEKCMIIALPIIAVVNRALVIHKRFEVATRYEQIQLYARLGFSSLIASIFAWYFNTDKFRGARHIFSSDNQIFF